jgi:protein SCO1/2
MKAVRIFLWVLVALCAGLGGYVLLNGSGAQNPLQAQNVKKFGTEFNLVSHTGAPITQDAFVGRNHAIFFGFTNCPDICPTTLYDAAGWLKTLGDDGNKVDFYFVTADPERDTVEVLKDYVTAFDPRITGITGDPTEIKKLIDAYPVSAKRVDLDDGDYTVDHSAFIMLFNETGELKGTISFDEVDTNAVAKLRRLVGNT